MPAISWRQAMVTTATWGTRKGGKERRERKGKRQGEKGRKSLARASSLKWFGERWHAKLESSVSPSPLWLHIKRNREKFFPTKINGARGTTRSLNNTDYLVCALSESVRISSCLIKVLLLFFPRTQVCANFPTIHVQLFKSLAKKKKKVLFSSIASQYEKKQVLGQKHLTNKIYTKRLSCTKGKISDRINGWKLYRDFVHCMLPTREYV